MHLHHPTGYIIHIKAAATSGCITIPMPVKIMFGTAFNLLVLAALVAASLLVLPSEGTPVMNDTVDRPETDYKALFVAYLDMGTALFGTWAPEGVMEEWIRKRQAFYDA